MDNATSGYKQEVIKILVFGAVVVVGYDTLASIISLLTGIRYDVFALGSFLISLTFGFLLARKTKWYYGALSGAVNGLTEATLGWAISWSIGPGKPDFATDGVMIVIIAVLAINIGAVLGLVGGLFSLLFRRDA